MQRGEIDRLKNKIAKYNYKINQADKFTTPERLTTYHSNLDYYKKSLQQLLVKHVDPPHPKEQTLTGHDAIVTSASFSPDGKSIVSSSCEKNNNKTSKILWSIERDVCIKSFDYSNVTSITFSPDSKSIVSSGQDDGTDKYIIKIWDVTSNECFKTFEGHAGWVTSATFSRDSTKIVSCSDDGDDSAIKIWSVDSGTCDGTIEKNSVINFTSSITPVLSADNKWILASIGDKNIGILSVDTPCNIVHTLSRHKKKITSAC